MKHINPNDPVTLDISALSYGPYGIGRLSGKAVMIPHTAPGDTVEARIVQSKDRYGIGEPIRLIVPSPLRQRPPCPYVSRCGGCPWQHLRYDAQLEAKQRNVADALQRIGKLNDFELKPILPAAGEYHYRRRIRLQTNSKKELGFYGGASHQLVEIDSCLIADDRLNAILPRLRDWTRRVQTLIEYIEVVAGDDSGKIVIAARAIGSFAPGDELLCANLIADEENVQGLLCHGAGWRRTWGEPAVTLGLYDELQLRVDADVFTQVNAKGNRQMIDQLLSATRFQPSDRVLELYSGAGNFTLPIASRAQEVVAVEANRAAVLQGKLNAQKNDLTNIRWISAEVPKALSKLKRRGERFTKIVLDPPRSGAKDIELYLPSLGATQISYISCNPATLARDLAGLVKHGYRIQLIQPIDFFPQTFHVEVLAVLERRA